jgi:hypothetical protein
MVAARPIRIGLGLLIGTVLGFGLWGWRINSQAESSEPIPRDLTGAALAEALGLELQPSFFAGCSHYVEVEESGVGYCLDEIAMTNAEAWDVGQRLRGYVPSELDWRIFGLADQIAHAYDAGDLATVEALAAELDLLLAERDGQQDGQADNGAFLIDEEVV